MRIITITTIKMPAAADLLTQGIKDFEKGNEKIAQALELLAGGQP
jgi:hypothetical protein